MSLETLGGVLLAGGKRALREHEAPWLPKLLELVGNKPVLSYPLQAIRGMTRVSINSITTIISARYGEQLKEFLRPHSVEIAIQTTHHGTAHAIWEAINQGAYPNTDYVLILMGDQPLITSEDLDAFFGYMVQSKQRAGILTFEESRQNDDYKKCGVVHKNAYGEFTHIASRTPVPQNKKETLHAGPYLFQASWLRGVLTSLSKYHTHHTDDMPEWHLYEALEAARADTGVSICTSPHPENFLGVDTLHALEEVRHRMMSRKQ